MAYALSLFAMFLMFGGVAFVVLGLFVRDRDAYVGSMFFAQLCLVTSIFFSFLSVVV